MSLACVRALRSMTSSASARRVLADLARRSMRDPAEHRVERRAQLVRERGQELVLGAVGLLRLRARLALERHQPPQPLAGLALRLFGRAQLRRVARRGFPRVQLGAHDPEERERQEHPAEQHAACQPR